MLEGEPPESFARAFLTSLQQVSGELLGLTYEEWIKRERDQFRDEMLRVWMHFNQDKGGTDA